MPASPLPAAGLQLQNYRAGAAESREQRAKLRGSVVLMAGKPARLPSSNQVIHATALVQRAEKEAAFCGAAVETLGREVEKMEEALERAQIKAQAASGCFGACFPVEIPTDHPTVLRIAETKDMAESLKDRKLAMTLHTEKVNRLIASMAKEASGQRNWKNFFPDHRLQDLLNTTMELENYLRNTTVAQQAAIGLGLDPLHGAPGQPGDAELSIEPSAPPMPQEPVVIERLKPECPLCLEPINDLACGPCGHVFCDECIKGAIISSPQCPICRNCMTVDQIHRIFMG